MDMSIFPDRNNFPLLEDTAACWNVRRTRGCAVSRMISGQMAHGNVLWHSRCLASMLKLARQKG